MSPQRVGGVLSEVRVTVKKCIERDCGGLAEIGFPTGGGGKKNNINVTATEN